MINHLQVDPCHPGRRARFVSATALPNAAVPCLTRRSSELRLGDLRRGDDRWENPPEPMVEPSIFAGFLGEFPMISGIDLLESTMAPMI